MGINSLLGDEIPETWENTTLGMIADFINGDRGKNYPSSLDRVMSGLPFINTGHIEPNGRLSNERMDYITRERFNMLGSGKVQPGDIVYCLRGSTIGKTARNHYDEGAIASSLAIIRAKPNADQDFLYYFLVSPKGQHLAKEHDNGSAQPNLSAKSLGQYPLRLPPLAEQKAIAHILGSLDDKIELNRQMNETLEAMAQALFKSCFVDFDPVIDNALAAGNPIPEPLQARAAARKALGDRRKPLPEELQKQFSDRFVFNDDLGWVPEGWKIQPFGEMIEQTIGGDWGKEDPDEKHQKCVAIIRGTDIPSVKSGAIGSIPTRWVEEKKFKTRELCDGDIVIEVSGGSPKQPTGRAAYVTAANLEMLGGNCVPASFCRKFSPKSKSLGFYAAQHLDRIYSIGKMWGYQNQSTGISNFQTKTFLETELVLLPDSDVILDKFFEIARPMIDKGRSGENEDLAKLRDTLLPKLLSGELRIPDAEKLVAEAL